MRIQPLHFETNFFILDSLAKLALLQLVECTYFFAVFSKKPADSIKKSTSSSRLYFASRKHFGISLKCH